MSNRRINCIRRILGAPDGEKVRRIILDSLEKDGGPGSGNFGHSGRPGQRGGSGEGGSVVSGMKSGSYVRSRDGYAQFTSRQAANEFSEACGKKVKLTERQREAIAEFQVSSAEMNHRLRAGDDRTDGYNIKDIDAALKKSELPDDAVLFRGVSGESIAALGIAESNPDALREMVGTTVSDPAYLSVTADQSVMTKFARSADGNQGIGIIIKAASGSKALPVSAANTEYGNRESEFILPRNTMLKVTGVMERNGLPIMVCEYGQKHEGGYVDEQE